MGTPQYHSSTLKLFTHANLLFFAALIALLSLSLIAVSVSLSRSNHHDGLLSARLARKRAQEAELRLAIDALMDLLRNIIDAALLSGNRPEVLLRDLRSRIDVEIDSEKSLVKDCRLFANLRYNGLGDYLERHYPALNKQEILLCCIISLGLPSDNLRFLLGHGNIGSIYNRNSRIRKKLGISRSSIPLDEFLYRLTLELEKKRIEEENFRINEK